MRTSQRSTLGPVIASKVFIESSGQMPVLTYSADCASATSAGSMQQTRGGCQNAIASKEEPVAVSVLRVSVRGVLGDARRGRAGLTLVLRAEARRTVRPVDRGGQAQKADLSDAHSVIEGDRHLRLVR